MLVFALSWIELLCILLLGSVWCYISGTVLNYDQSICYMCKVPYILPEEEIAIHITGGAFSFFDSRIGYIYSSDSAVSPKESKEDFLYREEHESLGQLVISVNQIHQDSPCMYSLVGSAKVTINGVEQLLSLERIGYINDSENAAIYYRLTCTAESGCDSSVDKVYMTCFGCYREQSVLAGTPSYISQTGTLTASYSFFITGRNELEAERHLQNRIAKATVF